jgi:hypothetical protein
MVKSMKAAELRVYQTVVGEKIDYAHPMKKDVKGKNFSPPL